MIPPSGRTCRSWAAFPLLPCSFPEGWSRPGRLPSCPTQQTAQAPSTLVQKALPFLWWGVEVSLDLEARILEWVAITGEDPFPGDLPDPGIKPASLQANSLPTEPPGSSVIDIFPILKSFLVGTPKFYSLSKFQLCHTVLSASPHHTLRSSDLIPLTADSLNPFTHLSLFPPAPPSSPDNHHSTHWF